MVKKLIHHMVIAFSLKTLLTNEDLHLLVIHLMVTILILSVSNSCSLFFLSALSYTCTLAHFVIILLLWLVIIIFD